MWEGAIQIDLFIVVRGNIHIHCKDSHQNGNSDKNEISSLTGILSSYYFIFFCQKNHKKTRTMIHCTALDSAFYHRICMCLFVGIDPLVEVKVGKVLWWVLRQGHFLIVEDHPMTFLEDVTHIVTDHCRSSHVGDEGH